MPVGAPDPIERGRRWWFGMQSSVTRPPTARRAMWIARLLWHGCRICGMPFVVRVKGGHPNRPNQGEA
jgi:hypothetical protein